MSFVVGAVALCTIEKGRAALLNTSIIFFLCFCASKADAVLDRLLVMRFAIGGFLGFAERNDLGHRLIRSFRFFAERAEADDFCAGLRWSVFSLCARFFFAHIRFFILSFRLFLRSQGFGGRVIIGSIIARQFKFQTEIDGRIPEARDRFKGNDEFSGMPPKERPTSSCDEVTFRSQN